MDKKYRERKARISHKWIKSRSGNSYLCPVASLLDESSSEEELRSECVDESRNPQND